MRVITGSAKGRKLFSPGKLIIRPTSDKVKCALFNVLGTAVKGSSFLDLFAGTGAIGIEALSRGAEQVQFVEINKKAIELIRKNLAHCGFDDLIYKINVNVIPADAQRIIEKLYRLGKVFDFIFVDTPYHSGLSSRILASITRFPIINPSGRIIVEHIIRRPIPDKTDCLMLERRTSYGDTSLSYYTVRTDTKKPKII